MCRYNEVAGGERPGGEVHMSDPTPAQPPREGPVERLLHLWRQGERPDLDAFLAEVGPLPPAELAAVLRADQRQRWQAGERVPAEDNLRRFPALRAEAEHAIDLIYGEFLLRERLGERPTAEEYLRRFPEHAEALGAQIDLHRAMRGDVSGGTEPPPGEPTLPYPGAPPGHGPAALVPEAGRAGPEGDVRELLRQRLLLLFLIGIVGVAVRVLPLLADQTPGRAGSLVMARAMLVIALALTAPAAFLWRRPDLSLARLRLVELGGVGIVAGVLLALTVIAPSLGLVPARYAALGGRGLAALARCVSLPWFATLVFYGMFVPNTWRRCAAVVGVLALTPLAVSAFQVLSDGELPPAACFTYLSEMAWWLGIGAAMAVYGCHKISVLRQQAAEARKLGHYQLKRRLGTGGMGEVYLAEHVLLRRPCAVKLIRPERAGDPQALRRFEREVQATAALTHPNTVEVYDYGRAEDGTFYYAMEYLPGLSLEQLVARHGPLPPARAVHLLRQVLGALAEAHAAGLVHRDIKPGNVIVGARGGRHDVAKLHDFGLVRAPDLGGGGETLTQQGTIAGTPAYMSPEQAKGLEDLDARSDVYSLGALAYFLLAGRPPFAGRSAVEALAAHLYEAPPQLRERRPEVPADLEAVVLRCLDKEPARRFPDVAGLEKALAACAAGAWAEEDAAAWWRGVGGSLPAAAS
jgi:serine/threonine-protein kinase